MRCRTYSWGCVEGKLLSALNQCLIYWMPITNLITYCKISVCFISNALFSFHFILNSWESNSFGFHQIASDVDFNAYARFKRHHTRCSLRKLSCAMHFTNIAACNARSEQIQTRICIIEWYSQWNRSFATSKRWRGLFKTFSISDIRLHNNKNQ